MRDLVGHWEELGAVRFIGHFRREARRFGAVLVYVENINMCVCFS